LRFGSLDDARVRYLFAGVVKGIGDYGNCVGIPNIGGEVAFDEAYAGNPLVNAMAIGILKVEDLIRGEATGVGNPILAVGARTGRDGIHGATFASEELAEEGEAKRPQVQVGDPFTEKLLLEASLELISSGHIVGIQDMGAAGLASSSTEMAARSGTGVEIDTALVPVREQGMTPYEILLSESQERMLVVAKAGHENDVVAILEKWELEAAVIGRVTDDGIYRVRHDGDVVCEIPGHPLVNGCPTYVREAREGDDVRRLRETDVDDLFGRPVPEPGDALLRLLASPTIASKRWVYEQYDSTVRTNTVVGPGGDAGVLRVRGTHRGIAATVDCNSRYVYLNPREGAKAAVAEAARNLVCVGARPRAVTDNLNFGSPLRPEVYHQMKEAVAGIGEACRAFDTPVVSGNVSLYNENPRGAIHPTPVIGMVGVLDDVSTYVTAGFKQPGDAIVLLGENTSEIGGSEYLALLFDAVAGEPPRVDLEREKALQECMLELTDARLLRSAHDCAEGGLAVALAECCVHDPRRPLGADVELEDELPAAQHLFGEAQGRVVVTCAAADVGRVLGVARAAGVTAALIGHVMGEGEGEGTATASGTPTRTPTPTPAVLRIRTPAGLAIELPIDEIAEAWHGAIPRIMEGDPAAVEVALEHPAEPR
ncbi:MAG: phosphoribosylformylglycinamidine synthase subunit PurL, partial [Longimicrobiales bacterium]